MFRILNDFLTMLMFKSVIEHYKATSYFLEHEGPWDQNLWINNSFMKDVNACYPNFFEKG